MNFLLVTLALSLSSSALAESIKIESIPLDNTLSASHSGNCDPNPGRCTVKDQSGSSEASYCWGRNEKGIIRCYADVEYQNGTRMRVWGTNCYDSYSDCWWSGKGKVDPCN